MNFVIDLLMMGVWRAVSVICKITFFFPPQLSNSEQKWWLKFIDYGYSYHSPYVEYCFILSLTQLGNVVENLCYSPAELGCLTARAALCKAAAKDHQLPTSKILAFQNTVAVHCFKNTLERLLSIMLSCLDSVQAIAACSE